jgi:hypothetical protein
MLQRAFAFVVLSLAACSSVPPPQPQPSVVAASRDVAALRIVVTNADSRRAEAAGEREVTGFTLAVRSAFQELLSRAGWIVVLDPDAPHDVELRVVTEYESRAAGDHGRLMTSLTLKAPGGVVEQQSGIVPVLEYADVDLQGVARLVEALGASVRVQRYAARVSRPDVPCAPAGPTLAVPGAEPAPSAAPGVE